MPKASRAGEYHRVDAFLSSDGDPCGLAVAESAELQSSSLHPCPKAV